MPCACSNRAAAALLPLPMPPVRPMISLSEKVIAIPTSPAQFKGRQYTEKGRQGCSAPASPSFALAGAPTQVEPLAGHLRPPPYCRSTRPGCERSPAAPESPAPPNRTEAVLLRANSVVGAPAGTPDRPGANDGPVKHQTP